MREEDRQRTSSPLESERGRTRIKDSVVSKIAGAAAGEVEGIFMGGGTSRAGVLGSVTGSRGKTQGISVEVGRTEAAIDVTMGIEYGGNILQLAERVRRGISERVEELTGLRVTELNVTVSDIVFPEGEESRTPARRMEEIDTGNREREAEDTGSVDLGAARAGAIRSGSRFSEETIRAENPPSQEDETVELSLDDEETRRREG